MPDIRLAKLPDRTPVKLSIIVTPRPHGLCGHVWQGLWSAGGGHRTCSGYAHGVPRKQPGVRQGASRRDGEADDVSQHTNEVVLFALATCLRQGNILGLTWDRVDTTRRIAAIQHSDTKKGGALGIPLNDVALGVLARQRGKHATHVFTWRGRPLRNANNRTWRAALKACGIENFRWHDLRHTWASWLRQNDVPTWVLQELGGWKSETMVRRYAHMSVKHLQPYADQLIFPVTPGNRQEPWKAAEPAGHKNGHSQAVPRLKLVAGTDLSHCL